VLLASQESGAEAAAPEVLPPAKMLVLAGASR
jgi:hypothetical protein